MITITDVYLILKEILFLGEILQTHFNRPANQMMDVMKSHNTTLKT